MTKDLIINDLIDKNNQLSNLIIRNAQNISNQELEEIFNNTIQMQEKFSAIISSQYMLSSTELVEGENIKFNLSTITFIIFQYIMELINKILYSLIYCLLIKYQSKICDTCNSELYNIIPHLKFVDDFKNNLQLVDIYISTDYGIHTFYEVKHKNNIKEYFQELISININSIIYSDILKLSKYRTIADSYFGIAVHNYKNIGYSDISIGYIFFWLDFHMNKHSYNYGDQKFILYKDCSLQRLDNIFKSITYGGLDIKWVTNAANIVKDIKVISDKLNQKVYIPNFQCNNLFDLLTGTIGLEKYTAQHHKDLINSFNKIRASIELDDYPLQQVIIHSHAYVIYVNTLYHNNNEYKVFICRYFDKIKIKITNDTNQISVRLKRKILNNMHFKKSLIDINKKYFTPDVTLMENINKFLQRNGLI